MTGLNSQKEHIRMIDLDNQTRFFSEQPSGFLRSTSHLKIVFLEKVIRFSYRAPPFFQWRVDRPKSPTKIAHVWCFFELKHFFPFRNYQLYFFNQVSIDKFLFVNSFQTWNIVSHCSQWKLDGLEMQKITHEYSSSWSSNSFISKSTKWTSSIIVKVRIFKTCNLIFLHDSRLQTILQPSKARSTVSYWQKVILF